MKRNSKREAIMPEVSRLKDRLGNTYAMIHGRPDGKLEIRDHLGNLQGTYDHRTDKTYDKLGNAIGGGNLLATLVARPK